MTQPETRTGPVPGAPGPAEAYFVCATPRTGSSLLLGLLQSTGVAGRPQAYFRAPDELLWAERWGIPRTPEGRFDYADYVRAALRAGRTGNGVFGAKLMWGTAGELTAKLGRVHPDLAGQDAALLDRAFGRSRYLYLRRRDAVAQAVSWLRAEQTGVWYAGGSGEISGNSGSGRGPVFDQDRIRRLVRMIDEHNVAWERWFASCGIRPRQVAYEDLDADMPGVTRSVLEFLGVALPDGGVVVPHHRRQADGLNAEWIDRYRAGTSGH